MKKTKVDFFGRATNGYGDDVKQFMSKKLNLTIELFTDAMCQYIETNYYAWWYYEVVGGGDDKSSWFGIENCIYDDIINHACGLLIAHGDDELQKVCDENDIEY